MSSDFSSAARPAGILWVTTRLPMQFHSSACKGRKKALLWYAAWLALGSLAGCKRPEPGSAAAPSAGALRPLNLVVVTIDTLRPDHLHCYGYPRIETPTLDGIAQAGVLFENAVTPTPLTPPSHASIFTGL